MNAPYPSLELRCTTVPREQILPSARTEHTAVGVLYDLHYDDNASILGKAVIGNCETHSELAIASNTGIFAYTNNTFTHGKVGAFGLFNAGMNMPAITVTLQQERHTGGQVNARYVAVGMGALLATALHGLMAKNGLHIPALHVVSEPTLPPNTDIKLYVSS